MKNGKVILRKPKTAFTDKWRKISFRLDRLEGEIPKVERLRSEDSEHTAISSSAEETMKKLNSLGAQNIQQAGLSLDEIAVEILKG